MRISCATSANDISDTSADLIVLPEGTSWEQIHAASSRCPNAIIVGAVTEGTFSRGVLLHRGKNTIEYLKVMSDGSNNTQQTPVFESATACIGILVCMDVDHVEFSRRVIETIKASPKAFKVLCVPADMGSQWFTNTELPAQYHGVHVALSNNNTYEVRCKSFIANAHGTKVKEQKNLEPIYDPEH